MIASVVTVGYTKSDGTVYLRPDSADLRGDLMRQADLQHLTADEFDAAVDLMARNGELVKATGSIG